MKRCGFCNVEIPQERERECYREVFGWERPGRGAGGKSGSSLVLRVATGAIAHESCITRAKMGLHPHQEALWSG